MWIVGCTLLKCFQLNHHNHHHHHHHHLLTSIFQYSAGVRGFPTSNTSTPSHPVLNADSLTSSNSDDAGPAQHTRPRFSLVCICLSLALIQPQTSTGRHSIFATFTFYVTEPSQSATSDNISNRFHIQTLAQFSTRSSVPKFNPTHPSPHHMFCPLQRSRSS